MGGYNEKTDDANTITGTAACSGEAAGRKRSWKYQQKEITELEEKINNMQGDNEELQQKSWCKESRARRTREEIRRKPAAWWRGEKLRNQQKLKDKENEE